MMRHVTPFFIAMALIAACASDNEADAYGPPYRSRFTRQPVYTGYGPGYYGGNTWSNNGYSSYGNGPYGYGYGPGNYGYGPVNGGAFPSNGAYGNYDDNNGTYYGGYGTSYYDRGSPVGGSIYLPFGLGFSSGFTNGW